MGDQDPAAWFGQFPAAPDGWASEQWCWRHWAPCPLLGANGLGAAAEAMSAFLNEVAILPATPDGLNTQMHAAGRLCCTLGDGRMYEIWGHWPPVPAEAKERPSPTMQTLYASAELGVPGNCLQAAIASLLNLPLSEVPHFVGDDVATDGEAHWWTCWRRWCAERGLTVRDAVEPEPGELYLGGGPSPRDPDNVSHVAVYRDGVLVHDPHPDGTGVAEIRTRWTIREAAS